MILEMSRPGKLAPTSLNGAYEGLGFIWPRFNDSNLFLSSKTICNSKSLFHFTTGESEKNVRRGHDSLMVDATTEHVYFMI